MINESSVYNEEIKEQLRELFFHYIKKNKKELLLDELNDIFSDSENQLSKNEDQVEEPIYEYVALERLIDPLVEAIEKNTATLETLNKNINNIILSSEEEQESLENVNEMPLLKKKEEQIKKVFVKLFRHKLGVNTFNDYISYLEVEQEFGVFTIYFYLKKWFPDKLWRKVIEIITDVEVIVDKPIEFEKQLVK